VVAAALRRAHLLRVAVRQGAAGARRGRRDLRAYGPLDRGGRLDHLELCGRETRNICTAGYKAIHQDEGSPSPEYLAALLEATAFGTREIIEAFEAAGVQVDELVIAGGLLKNPLLMQIYADVTRRELATIQSDQGPALGAAMHAAVAAGSYPDIGAATAAMGKVQRGAYTPDETSSRAYDRLYAEYSALHDYFGRGANEVMHRLRAIRRGS
jgi:ribulose kinase